MTDNDLSKEAERIVIAGSSAKWTHGQLRDAIVDAFRAVHASGFTEAREKAATALELKIIKDGPWMGDTVKQIRALKPESGGGE